VGVIGPNGVGKTTLLKMILGEEEPDAGTIRIGDTVRTSYVDQMRAGRSGSRDRVSRNRPGSGPAASGAG
jgi:ATPase subunit of ABC transporter with duplicated ATPase domains